MFKVVCEICQAIHADSIEVIETGAKSTVFFTDCVVVNRNDEGVSWEENVVVCRYCALRYGGVRHDDFSGNIVIDHEDTNRMFEDEVTEEDYRAYINGETGRYTEEELAS